jgi:hypothetical protein
VIGDELVTNGTFDTDTTGWTANSSGVLSSAGGQLNVRTVAPDNFSNANQAITCEIGKVYQITATKVSQTVNSPWGVATTAASTRDVVDFGSADTGAVTAIFVAPATTLYIQLTSISDTVSDGISVYDNISVREVIPNAVSIQMDGRVTYADVGNFGTGIPWRWQLDGGNRLSINLDTDTTLTGRFTVNQVENGIVDFATGGQEITAGVLTPYSIASRHGSVFTQIAVIGSNGSANTTPFALPDLSASDFTLGFTYNGTIRTLRIWPDDIGDTGIAEATIPSLEPSLSLTFDSSENSFIVEDWTE